MSGIVALLDRRQRRISTPTIDAMLRSAPGRWPDGTRAWVSGPVGLGHAKLTVTAEDALDVQPLTSPRTGCVITADVILDNRDELIAAFPAYRAANITDVELILLVYESWGVPGFARLLGDFAFAIWDTRLRTLILARDAAGQSSLFYRSDGHMFAAATDIRQLLQDPTVPIAPNDSRIRDFLGYRYGNEKEHPATFYEGIRSLPPGHVLIVGEHDERLLTYWELRPPREIRYRSDTEYGEHYLELLLQAIQPRLRSRGPVGAFLSGGLDSSSIVCGAAELYRAGRSPYRGFRGYTIRYQGLDCDEGDLVADIEEQTGFPTTYVTECEDEPFELEPSKFLDCPNAWFVRRYEPLFDSAAGYGARVLLTGEIADSYVGGSPLVFDSLLRHGRVAEALRQLAAFRHATGAPLRRVLPLYVVAPLLPLWAQRALMVRHVRREWSWKQFSAIPAWFTDELRHDLARRHESLALREASTRIFASPAREIEYRNLYPPELAWQPLAPVIVRRPFADRRLQLFMLAIPPEQKFGPYRMADENYAASKCIVRSALRGVIPERIRTRTVKTQFAPAFARSLERQWKLIEETFGPRGRAEVVTRGYVESALFLKRLRGIRDGELPTDFSYLRRVVQLEGWLRTFRLRRHELLPPQDSTDDLANLMSGQPPISDTSGDAALAASFGQVPGRRGGWATTSERRY